MNPSEPTGKQPEVEDEMTQGQMYLVQFFDPHDYGEDERVSVIWDELEQGKKLEVECAQLRAEAIGAGDRFPQLVSPPPYVNSKRAVKAEIDKQAEEIKRLKEELEKLSKFIWDATPPLNRTQIGNTVDGILKLLKHGKA